MFGIGSTELLIICVVALLVVGPSKLPSMLRSLGKGLAEFKRMGSDVKTTLESEITKAEEAAKKKEAEEKLEAKKKAEAEAEAAEDTGAPVAEAKTGESAEEAGSRGA